MFDIFTILIGYDEEGVVMTDRWSDERGRLLKRKQGWPSETLYHYSYSVPGLVR